MLYNHDTKILCETRFHARLIQNRRAVARDVVRFLCVVCCGGRLEQPSIATTHTLAHHMLKYMCVCIVHNNHHQRMRSTANLQTVARSSQPYIWCCTLHYTIHDIQHTTYSTREHRAHTQHIEEHLYINDRDYIFLAFTRMRGNDDDNNEYTQYFILMDWKENVCECVYAVVCCV